MKNIGIIWENILQKLILSISNGHGVIAHENQIPQYYLVNTEGN